MGSQIARTAEAVEQLTQTIQQSLKIQERAVLTADRLEKAEKKRQDALKKTSDGAGFANKSMGRLYDVLTSTGDEVKLFGVRAKTARKFMYGFLPPGAFRLVNKFATSLLAANSVMKAVKGEAVENEEAHMNIFTTLYRGYTQTLGFNMAESKMRRNKRKELKAEKNLIEKKEQDIRKAVEKTAKMQERLDKGQKRRRQPKRGGKKGKRETDEEFAERVEKLKLDFEKAAKDEEKANKAMEEHKELIEKLSVHELLFKDIADSAMEHLKGFMFGLGHVLKFVFYASLFLAVILGLFIALKPFFEDAFDQLWPIFQLFSTMFSDAFNDIYNGLLDFYVAMFSGDFEGMLMAAGIFLLGVGKLLVVSIAALVTVSIGLLWTVIWGLTKSAYKYFTTVEGGLKRFLVLATLFITTWLLWTKVDYMTKQPAWMIGIALFVIYKAVIFLLKHMDFLATGGAVASPLQVVGERGPELVNLPKGSRVHSNSDSKRMLSGGGGNTINVTVNATSTNDSEIRKIANKVATIINREVNRTTSSSMSR